MNLCGLTDSLATLHAAPNECRDCHTSSRIAHGLCLSCLLRAGADEGENVEANEFAAALDAVSVADTHWWLGNYEILEEIGRGGMGVIYRARQRHSRRIVALKRVLGYHADSRETLARFRREAEAAASLDHPNILPIYEVAESEEGVPYFSMKFAPGGSLQEVGPALRDDPREVVRLMAKVTRAVHYAHRQGILHRDLKPGNILLDGRGEPLVSDFGLAKWLDSSSDLTRTLTIFGTPGYIAPEQARGPAASLKPSSDIYSLGAILFDSLAGRPPFLGEHALAVIHQAAEDPAPKLRSLVRGANKDLEIICARCLEREPAVRYRSAGDLAEDLERWLEGRSIIARPILPPVRIWRWSRRKPALAASVAGVLLLGTVAVVRQWEAGQLAATIRDDQLSTNSIAVLPFLDLENAKPDYSLTLLITQALQTTLSSFGPARVTPLSQGNPYWADTASVEDIKEANRSLAARAVLTGSARLVQGKTRISIRLISAATGDNLLSQSFEVIPSAGIDGESLHLLAKRVYSILQARDWSAITIAGRDPGLRDETAREFIISGRQLMFRDTTQDLDRSMRCLEKAVELQPKSAIAHAYLAATASGRIHFAWDSALLARAEREARQALLLEPGLADGHRALAGVFYQTGQYAEALEEQLRAVETGGPEELVAAFLGTTFEKLGKPMRGLGWLEMARHWTSRPGDCDGLIGDCWSELGEDERAEKAYRRAMELRPGSSEGWVGLAHLWLLEGKVADARRLCQDNRERSLRENPSDPRSDQMAAQIEFFSRNYSEAERLYRELSAQYASKGADFYGSVTYTSALGRLQQLRGDQAAGQRTLGDARREESVSPTGTRTGAALYRLAAIEASLANNAVALDYLKEAISQGWSDARSPGLDPRFDALVGDPHFAKVITSLSQEMAKLRQQNKGHLIMMTSNGESTSPESEIKK